MVSKYAGYADMSMKEKYKLYEIETIGYLDIETSGLTADFDIMLTWANCVRDVKSGKTKIEYDFLVQKDFDLAKKKKNADLIDKGIVGTCLDSLNQCDLLVGHWFIGKYRHDIPFIRTRAVINKVKGFPHHKQIKYGDTQKWASLLYRNHNNSLDTTSRMFGLATKKTIIEPRIWKNACIGIPEDIQYILKHNILDVKITHKVHLGVEKFVPIASTYA